MDQSTITDLVALQLRLLTAVAPLLARHGRLVYATCTVHPRENSELIDSFLTTQPQLARVGQKQWWPGESTAVGEAGGGGDGFFAAVLQT
jgi:16S rRNA (cytosine967-C5)-methyltransferase